MSVKRRGIGPTFRALDHIFRSELGILVPASFPSSCSAFLIDAANSFKAVPDDHNKRDQDEEFG